jgi:hypothetical protein
MAAKLVLADPPPLTPTELRRFPFRIRTFPFDVLQQNADLTVLETRDESAPASLDPNRVE